LDTESAGSYAWSEIDCERTEESQVSPRIISYRNYVAGWLDSTVHDFLVDFSPNASAKYALITCLDSNPKPAALLEKSPELKPLADQAMILGTGLLLPSEVLLLAESDASSRVFFGFDEIWFFPSKRIQPKPSGVTLQGPARLTQGMFNRLAAWMSDNSCSLALGGGEGLNFAVRARGFGKYLLGYSIGQRDSALISA
jgi:hypothetical protein